MTNLLIVESPAKAKTLKKYLGKDFEVLASYGHVRDLIPKSGAVDTENGFAMKYQLLEKNKKHIDAICEAFKHADELYLATDPDREGEAIAWHLCEILKERGLLKKKIPHRVVFHEITKSAVKAAVKNPRALLQDLINAQQTRRALDYLVGFELSPLLWKKIRYGLSAGRVQSPALRMIVERQDLIDKFVPQEYWSITAALNKSKQKFDARLTVLEGEKLGQFSITDETQATKATDKLIKTAKGKLLVTKVTKSQRKRQPAPPFTTSTLQQESARKLRYSAQRTMRLAQQLYEGIDVGEGTTGLITYMRTDSVTLAQEALGEIRAFIAAKYGEQAVPAEIRVYKTKVKNAQEAHEAVRPTDVTKTPDQVKSYLTPEQFKLYELIWKRTVACQMQHALFDVLTVDLTCGKNTFRASGSTVVEPGFMQVYLEGVDEGEEVEVDEKMLPNLKEGESVEIKAITPNQHFTEPPPKFSEASLIKALAESGIGRPSTYEAIISTLQNRGYVLNENRRFHPTDVGKIVNKFLTKYFTQYVDYDFTAKLEDELDDIANGNSQWLPILDEFWQPFIKLVKQIEETVQRKDVTQEQLDENCPKCGQPLATRLGKSGSFIGCTGFPECDYTRSVNEDHESAQKAVQLVEGRSCPQCESPLSIKRGKYGSFIGCTSYPNCKYMEPLEKPEDTQITCPVCKEGSLTKRKSRYGTFFYSCNKYPDCKYIINNPPLAETCPQCEWPILMVKTTKRRGTEKVCPQKTCDYSIPMATSEE